ncbi:hypothetical protein [Methanonatronarchaeum sp. AMET6-2]|nr:hypothetical protein [Methanonatronarchaeum sp. AMET6-2]
MGKEPNKLTGVRGESPALQGGDESDTVFNRRLGFKRLEIPI